ncbi:hypothetical protein ACIXEI_11870, partial [Bacteroides fragilis]
NFFLADYEKHRGGLPCGRRREASEERHPACLSVLAFANIVTYFGYLFSDRYHLLQYDELFY